MVIMDMYKCWQLCSWRCNDHKEAQPVLWISMIINALTAKHMMLMQEVSIKTTGAQEITGASKQ